MPSISLDWYCEAGVREISDRVGALDKQGGVYLWVFQGEPKRVTYVGETGDFLGRTLEHCQGLIGGRYWVGDCEQREDYVDRLQDWFFAGGQLRSEDEILHDRRLFVPTNPERLDFARAFLDPGVSSMRVRFLMNLRFVFGRIAEVPDLAPSEVRRDIEGLLLKELRDDYAARCGFDPLRFHLPGYFANTTLLGRITHECKREYEVTHCGEALQAIPDEVLRILRSRL
jgi:hypothetical protein